MILGKQYPFWFVATYVWSEINSICDKHLAIYLYESNLWVFYFNILNDKRATTKSSAVYVIFENFKADQYAEIHHSDPGMVTMQFSLIWKSKQQIHAQIECEVFDLKAFWTPEHSLETFYKYHPHLLRRVEGQENRQIKSVTMKITISSARWETTR